VVSSYQGHQPAESVKWDISGQNAVILQVQAIASKIRSEMNWALNISRHPAELPRRKLAKERIYCNKTLYICIHRSDSQRAKSHFTRIVFTDRPPPNNTILMCCQAASINPRERRLGDAVEVAEAHPPSEFVQMESHSLVIIVWH
jgi:hypothetical protein